jgi:hypothetical protein
MEDHSATLSNRSSIVRSCVVFATQDDSTGHARID